MIAHLRGTLLEKHPNQAIVDAQGVGYDVTIPISTFSTLPNLGESVALRIHTHVREDAIALFGFAKAEEKALFEKLIAVSGIGPKLAITILSGLAASDLVQAIRGGAVERLVRIPGIGKKTAERIGLELKDRLPLATTAASGRPEDAAPGDEMRADLMSALTNLGYKGPVAERAVDSALKKTPGAPFEDVLRDILRGMTR